MLSIRGRYTTDLCGHRLREPESVGEHECPSESVRLAKGKFLLKDSLKDYTHIPLPNTLDFTRHLCRKEL